MKNPNKSNSYELTSMADGLRRTFKISLGQIPWLVVVSDMFLGIYNPKGKVTPVTGRGGL
jgi:hypothetical protein